MGDYISTALPTNYQHQTCDDNLTLNGALSNNYFGNSIENKQGRSLLKGKIKIKVREELITLKHFTNTSSINVGSASVDCSDLLRFLAKTYLKVFI